MGLPAGRRWRLAAIGQKRPEAAIEKPTATGHKRTLGSDRNGQKVDGRESCALARCVCLDAMVVKG